MGKKLDADPCTQPPCRPILDISHVSQNDHHTVRGGWRVMGFLGHVASIQSGSARWLGAEVWTQFFPRYGLVRSSHPLMYRDITQPLKQKDYLLNQSYYY